MTSQLSFLDEDAVAPATGLVAPRHLNHAVSSAAGLQEVAAVPASSSCQHS